MRREDTWEFQTERLTKLVAERVPGKIITFDQTHRVTVRFRIVASVTGIVIVDATGEWQPDRLAEKSDNDVWKLIQHLSNGKL
ncbi:MAG: hypothetical protein WCD49_10140 [Candidatus Acidiferrales bacterium]